MPNRILMSLLFIVTAMFMVFPVSKACFADEQAASAAEVGLLPIPDYSGDVWMRSHLTGDWGGLRQEWANKGVTLDFDWYQAYQNIVDGGVSEDSAFSTNLDYRAKLDLMRMGMVPGALITVRAQSRLGDTVNGQSGLLLPVNMYSAFPFSGDPDENVDFAVTELNWTQFLSDNFGFLAGKITTLATANEFMGGEGRTQFMSLQLSFSSVVAQLAPYSTLAVGAFWMPSSNWTVTSLLMNLKDSSTTTGFGDIGDGTTWATTVDYLGSLNDLPGGGSFSIYYAFDADFRRMGGLYIEPVAGVLTTTSEPDAWALTWSGWQYLFAEKGSGAADPRNGRQDLQGLGLFAQLGLADKDTNPVNWSISAGLSGRGSIPGRDADTWGVGFFYNKLQDIDYEAIDLKGSGSGIEAYYDMALFGWASLTLDMQWVQSGFPSIENATILGARLNVSF
jgi:porin